MYEPRSYRGSIRNNDLFTFQISVKETDLYIRAGLDLRVEARETVLQYRYEIEEYIRKNPQFQTSLIPVPKDPFAPVIVQAMIRASRAARVGPMASVAGTISEFLGRDLLRLSPEVIVENGGDIFLNTSFSTTVGVYAGTSPLSHRVGIKVHQNDMPMGICTSSGTVGHSKSYGRADAVTVLSKSTPLADAAATSIGNRIQDENDLKKCMEYADEIEGVTGVLIVLGSKMTAWGKLELVEI